MHFWIVGAGVGVRVGVAVGILDGCGVGLTYSSNGVPSVGKLKSMLRSRGFERHEPCELHSTDRVQLWHCGGLTWLTSQSRQLLELEWGETQAQDQLSLASTDKVPMLLHWTLSEN